MAASFASGIEHVPECENDNERRWKRRFKTSFVLVVGCPTRDAATERFFFLKIDTSRISHPNNIKFHKCWLILIHKHWQLVLRRDMSSDTSLKNYVFFVYQLASLQCFDVCQAVFFWFLKRKDYVFKKKKPLKNRNICIFDILKMNMYKQFKVLISTH